MSNERSQFSQTFDNGEDGDCHSIEDRNTKKVRFNDGLDDDTIAMAVDPDSTPMLSWKDKLLGRGTINPEMDRNALSAGRDSDFDLLDEDVKATIVNGIPTITFSDRVKDILFKDMELTVFLKLLGRSIGYNTLHNRIICLWKPANSFHLMDIENGYYLVRFQNKTDYDRVLTQGPWIIYGQYLTVQPWTMDFSPSLPYPSMVMAWIRLSGLLGFMCRQKIVGAIGGLIEKVVISRRITKPEVDSLNFLCLLISKSPWCPKF